MFPAREHHLKGSVCFTRPPYRNGKKLRGVKVYTIAQESKYLLIQNLSSIGGALEQLLPHLNEHGPVEQHWRLDGYQSKDEEEFVDTVLVQYRQIEHARRSKYFLDDWNFLGTHLHVCYAPECESVDDLRQKMQERRTIVQRKAEMNRRSSRKIRSSTAPVRSQASQRTTEDIRARMRDAVQKSNLISLVLQQEMKICTLILLLCVSGVHLRRSNSDLYDLDSLLEGKREHRPSHSSQQYLLDLLKHEEEFSPLFDGKKLYDDDDDEEQEEEDNSDPIRPSNSDQSSMIEGTTGRAVLTSSEQPGTCTNQYEVRSDQLVKVKYLQNNARMIRFISIDQPPVSSRLSLKEICMLKCCAEKTCDLAMLSEQRTHESYKCYLFACNGSCPLATHQDYSVMLMKKIAGYYTDSPVLETVASTSSAPVAQSPPSTRLSRLVVFLLVLFVLVTIVFLGMIFYYCRQTSKRGRRAKNYSVDADYLINGLYL